MNSQTNLLNDHNRSFVSFSDNIDNNCDYVISENFDVKDYLSDVLNVDCCDTYLTGNRNIFCGTIHVDIFVEHNFKTFFKF